VHVHERAGTEIACRCTCVDILYNLYILYIVIRYRRRACAQSGAKGPLSGVTPCGNQGDGTQHRPQSPGCLVRCVCSMILYQLRPIPVPLPAHYRRLRYFRHRKRRLSIVASPAAKQREPKRARSVGLKSRRYRHRYEHGNAVKVSVVFEQSGCLLIPETSCETSVKYSTFERSLIAIPEQYRNPPVAWD
jgi:hypothetical protein